MRKEVANDDDVSHLDVDLECGWRSSYRSADRRNREAAAKIAALVIKHGAGGVPFLIPT
jgi:hypothetical protein